MSATSNLSGYQFSDFKDPDAPGVHRFDVHQGGINVGYAQVEDQGRKGMFLDAVRVDDAHQGKGIGSALMHQVTSTYGHKPITLQANPYGNQALDRPALQSMYGKHGFKPAGEDGYMKRPRSRP